MKNYLNKNIEIPERLNILIAFTSITLATLLFWSMGQHDSIMYKLLIMLCFGYIGNTIFGLVHEAVHGVFHSNKKINYIFGNICSAFFPTAFSFQRFCHLNHHRNNRTDYEMFETYHEGDSFVLRTFILYSVLTGIYWTYPPLGSLWLLFSPKTLINSEFRTGNYKKGRTGSAGILRNLNLRSKKIINTMRLEVIFIILVQVSLFYFLNLKFTDWLLCYLGFALQWSGLQYADHAYSPRDIRNGAWNLKVSKLTQYLFLNYHYHLAHHQHPHVPWIHLPKFVDPSIETPSFFKIYLRMWKGLEKDTRDEPKDIDPELEKLIDYTPSSYADNPIKLNQATK